MFVYKLRCIPTKRVYVGTSKVYPEIYSLTVPREVQKDIDNFGENNFSINVICELKNKDKAEHKAEAMLERESNKYEIEPVEELAFEIVEQFPEYPIEE